MNYESVVLELRTILAIILGRDRDVLSDDDHLFEAGLNISSLTAIEILTGIEERFGIEFPVEMMDEHLFDSIHHIASIVSKLVTQIPGDTL
jgi:acyl carrier protein